MVYVSIKFSTEARPSRLGRKPCVVIQPIKDDTLADMEGCSNHTTMREAMNVVRAALDTPYT